MNKSYRRKIWKRAGVVLLGFLAIIAVLVALYECQELKSCMEEKVALEEQIRLYLQKEAEAKEKKELYAGNVREVFVEEIELAEHLQTGDRVDVRIRYFNAEDYLVLTDKKLVKCDSGNGMILELKEEEILLISSAITDCNNYDNTKLYVVEYPEELQGETGNANYIANKEILAMLERETTEGKSRIALEQRLAGKEQ